jgi:hypothetical protein
VDPVRHAFSVAVSTFHGNRMDVPRRLRPRGLFCSAQWKCESSLRDVGNCVAAPCSHRRQLYSTSDAARDDFLLCSGCSGNRVRVLRMGIRVRAFEGCRTPTPDGIDRLSSTVVRTKRDVVQSGQMIQHPDLATDVERSHTSVNMFEVEKPRAACEC